MPEEAYAGYEYDYDLYDLDELPKYRIDYATSLVIAKDRLEFMGFTMPTVKHLFEEGQKERLFDLSKYQINSSLAIEKSILEDLSFEKWLDGLAYIVQSKLCISTWRKQWTFEDLSLDESSRIVFYMLNHASEALGFPSHDYRPLIRAIIEVMGTDAELVYDLTSLISVGYFEDNHNFCEDARWYLSEDIKIQKIIVLTEGKSDKQVLESSLKLLYPHLSNYYSFMDFDSANVPGSASELVKTIKAFIGTNINSRVIALFDNDTAAQSAMRALQKIKIPKNIRTLRYPDIQIAQSYPTLEDQGLLNMNINGLACSLELYFGCDVLMDSDGSFIPIKWRGYDQGLHQHQGEILYKAKLQEKFKNKLQACQQNRNLIDEYDWIGIKAIIDLLRTAFHE